jgi:Zn finger protein HypA/HybF involved in hydrogenase expression
MATDHEYFRDNGWLKADAPRDVKVQHITKRLEALHEGSGLDFSDLEYISWEHPVKVYCNNHQGVIYKRVSNLLKGTRCGVCHSLSRVETQEQFLEKALEVHGTEKYRYDKAQYSNTDTKVDIYCNTCEEYFQQKPHYHLAGSNCPKCAGRFYKFLYILQSEDNPQLYKVGVSNNPDKRIVALRNELKNNWKTLSIHHLDGKSVLKLEQKIHFFLAGYKYRGSLVPKGDGYTEVFNIKDSRIILEINKVLISSGGINIDG